MPADNRNAEQGVNGQQCVNAQQQFARRGGNKAWARRTLTLGNPGFRRAAEPPAGRNFASVGPTVRPVDQNRAVILYAQ
jgi:hypothetical protein